MAANVFNPFPPQEPAHPGVIKLHDDLVKIYKILRESYQDKLNAAFDQLSRQIGFVVRTTLPVTLSIAAKEGRVSLTGENFRGTIFEKTFLEVLNDLPKKAQGTVADGNYKLYVIWYDALKLKLHTDWMEPAHLYWLEPAHVAQGLGEAQIPQRAPLGPGPFEPAHWFDPGFRFELEESLAISAIDQVYPELRLAERVRAARQLPRTAMTPGIREPAHFQQQLLARSGSAVLSPGIREPAHFRQILEQFDAPTLDSVIAVLQAIQKLR
jgi:hypothetical protein